MLGGILEGQQRTCFQARTSRINFSIDFSSGSPVSSDPDVFVALSGVAANIWTCEITKDFPTTFFIEAQLTTTGDPTTTPSLRNIIQVTVPFSGKNTFLAGGGQGESTRFNFCMNNAATGAITPITSLIYFELVMQNSTFGY